MNDDQNGDDAMKRFEDLLGKLVHKKPEVEDIAEDEPDDDASEPSEDE